jgi:hypothetical protein
VPADPRHVAASSGPSFDFTRIAVDAPRLGLPRKLAVGAADDAFEREADQIADRVMRMPEPAAAIATAAAPRISRKCACGGDAGASGECAECQEKREGTLQRRAANGARSEAVPPIVHEVLRSPGTQLDQATRSFFEPRVGHDFSRVRVHADARAAASARAVDATAYTVGHHVVFKSGRYAPASDDGKRLLGHELVHVVQQRERGASGLGSDSTGDRNDTDRPSVVPRVQRQPSRSGDDDPIHRPLIEQFRQQQGLPPGGVDPSGQQVGPTDAEIKYQIIPQQLAAQPPARFITPTRQSQDPLARLLAGDPPGLTTPTINGAHMTSDQDLLAGIVPNQVTTTGGGQGGAANVTCQALRNFEFSISAEMIVASDPGPQGWTAAIPSPAVLGTNSPAQCTGHANIPVKMNAQPNNADFVTRVRTSEQEHADEIHELHRRHLIPYGQFLMGLQGTGANLGDCGQNFITQLRPRARQAALGFVFGYAAATAKLDDPSGTHIDNAVIHADASCGAIDITLSGHPRVPGSEPGNVVPVAPTVTTFKPANLRVNGTGLQDGGTIVKTFSTPQLAQQALQTIQHYGMTSRNVIDSMEYFLVGSAAPSGSLAGANEFPIDPDLYQVNRNLPSMQNDWVIAQVVGANIQTIVNFHANRNAAYSAYNVMRQHRFTNLCWIGGTRQSPEMLYFRT